MNYLKNGAKEERRGAPMKKLTRSLPHDSFNFIRRVQRRPEYHRPAAQNPATFRDLSENRRSRLRQRLTPIFLVAVSRIRNTRTHPHRAEAKLRLANRYGAHQRRARAACRNAF